eukprot:CAMPEP_0175052962 /NCGR_PEP_ID=MMETSP0052_2-20121109/8652_1 /TAXON_ID=51329 ORGANISM="Polytomella parva, Strain SAG 63-3" /NCGR_SAMPLE_ID=MMETSP0052_2 /ASSEMBLY_ACC=CAM_ASM_000194 /LENGTH=74 /DNA_ID=CAMNT_0016317427 /DNA_START=997 /DNA_END=1221 /DNA_ORIENTATION=+
MAFSCDLPKKTLAALSRDERPNFSRGIVTCEDCAWGPSADVASYVPGPGALVCEGIWAGRPLEMSERLLFPWNV